MNTTARRLFRASNISRNQELAENSGPLEGGQNLGVNAAIMSATPRGVLERANVGDVASVMDDMGKALASMLGKGGQVDRRG
ncbi:MAG: hypothetical protein HY804_01370 [Nitrospinae bacterium]|nr:hypothetical protein [Nitrospinota bacterium]